MTCPCVHLSHLDFPLQSVVRTFLSLCVLCSTGIHIHNFQFINIYVFISNSDCYWPIDAPSYRYRIICKLISKFYNINNRKRRFAWSVAENVDAVCCCCWWYFGHADTELNCFRAQSDYRKWWCLATALSHRVRVLYSGFECKQAEKQA